MGHTGRCVIVVLVAGLSAAAAASEAPVAVSPGHSTRLAQVEGRCPTFNWGAVPGARSYELVVYQLPEEDSGEEARSVVRTTVPGSALGWTPALDRCLERGGRYAWWVRATGDKGPSEWSSPALFEIPAPTAGQFAEALEVVRSYLAIQAATRAEAAARDEAEVGAESGSEPAGSSGAPGTRAAVATALKVDLGVEAASFKGDGSELTALDPAKLSAGTAGIGITGNAATAGALASNPPNCPAGQSPNGIDATGAGEMCFDVTTQSELDAHKGSTDHDTAYVNTSGDTMTGSLSMGSNSITEIGAPGTGFTATGGLTLADDLEMSKVLVMPHTVDSASGVLYKHSSTPPPGSSQTFLHNFNAAGTDGSNLFLGPNAGNFTMSIGSTPDVLHASYNTGIGTDVLHQNTTGNANTGTGSGALANNTKGFRNTANGTWSLLHNTEGSGNTASGVDSLYANTTGGSNTAFGLSALWTNTVGASNTAVGADALLYNATGEENIALGFKAGENLTSGSHNIIIGVDIDAPSATGNNQMSIGNLIFATGVDGRDLAVSTGNVGVGTASPAQRLDVMGTVRATAFLGDGSGLTGVSADTAANANLLDSLDSTQFLRSDTDGTIVGTLTLSTAAGTSDSLIARDRPNTRIASMHDDSANAIAGFEAFGPGGSVPNTGGFILAVAKGTKHMSSVADNDPYLHIRHTNDSFHVGDEAPILTVDAQTSRVGIGITGPGEKLEVSGNVKATSFMGGGSGLTGVSADTAADSALLDSLDSLQFLRSDASDAFASGTLTLAGGTTLDIDGSLALPTTGITGGGSGSGLNADLLDGSEAVALEESAEIDADIQAHEGDASAHHAPTVDTTCSGVSCDGGSFTNVTAGILTGRVDNLDSASGTIYGFVSGHTTDPSATESLVTSLSPSSICVAEDLAVELNTAPGSGYSRTFTLRVEGTSTSVSCVISDVSTTCNTGSITHAIAAGSELSLEISSSGSPPSASALFGWRCRL